MDINYLDFEQPIAKLQQKIHELRLLSKSNDVDFAKQIDELEDKIVKKTKVVFKQLTIPQIVKMARHPLRPNTQDYIQAIFTDFDELSGDRQFSDGPAIIAGLAYLEGRSVVVIGHQKGKTTKEKIARNFAMPRPEEYRKALRVMRLAERYNLPVITFIDTPGAYPGVGAEERNQSGAIAENLLAMSKLEVPIVSVVIGEGGSGGALAIGVADRVFMLQYSIYSVISPEGCASILWKTAEKSAEAAEAMKVDASNNLKLGLIDKIITEPLGGAHRDPQKIAQSVKSELITSINQLADNLTVKKLLDQRYKRLMSYGV